jgi:soluble lytic murein transglycosylase-like protein
MAAQGSAAWALAGVALALVACQTPGPLPAARPPAAESLPAPAPEPPSPVRRLVAAVLAERGPRIPEPERERVAEVLERAEQSRGLDALLVLAVIEQESRFDPSARARSGALGLMQVRPFVGADVARRHGIRWEGPQTLLEPASNVQLGTLYLAEMFDLYGDLDVALAAYNLGPTRVRRLLARGQRPRPRYVGRVEAALEGLAARFGHQRW